MIVQNKSKLSMALVGWRTSHAEAARLLSMADGSVSGWAITEDDNGD